MNFNPRSYMRSDQLRDRSNQRGGYFNPRSYMRSDFHLMMKIPCRLFQSTILHEERLGTPARPRHPVQFQSTLLHEERQSNSLTRHYQFPFQSTLLHEERRPGRRGGCLFRLYFNPRSYMRSDHRHFCLRQPSSISIHAPT